MQTFSNLENISIRVRQLRRISIYKLAGRICNICRRYMARHKSVAEAAKFISIDAAGYEVKVSADLAESIYKYRSELFPGCPDKVINGELLLRGNIRRVGPLIDFKWRSLGLNGEDALNEDYELSYLGFLVPPAKFAGESYFDHVAAILENMEAEASKGDWIYSLVWKPISVSCRLINIVSIIYFGDRSSNFRPHARSIIIRHASLCYHFLKQFREDFLGYNHLAFNLVAIACWKAATNRSLPIPDQYYIIDILREQILADGGHAERTPTYHVHLMVLIDLLQQIPDLSPSIMKELQEIYGRMKHALECMMHPDGDIAVINDSSLGDAPPASVFFPVSYASCKRIGVSTLKNMGLVSLNSASSMIIMDTAPAHTSNCLGHTHAGFLTCELSYMGKRLIIDPGVASYKYGTYRNWSRSSLSHNGPSTAFREPMQFSSVFAYGDYSLGSFVKLTEFTKHKARAVMAFFKPYYALEDIVMRIVVQTDDGTGILISDIWSNPKDVFAGTFKLHPAWVLNGLTHGAECTYKSKEDGETISCTFDALIGVMSLSSGEAFLSGPGLMMASKDILVEPQLVGNLAIRIIAIGDNAVVESARDWGRDLFDMEWVNRKLASLSDD